MPLLDSRGYLNLLFLYATCNNAAETLRRYRETSTTHHIQLDEGRFYVLMIVSPIISPLYHEQLRMTKEEMKKECCGIWNVIQELVGDKRVDISE
jgi:hypothetical protein